jgi:hypothetical protein
VIAQLGDTRFNEGLTFGGGGDIFSGESELYINCLGGQCYANNASDKLRSRPVYAG